MYANGQGTIEIMNFLNSNKYLSPSGYRKTGKVKDKNETKYDWNEVTLCNMLKNEVYIGNTIQNKKTVVSYKVKKIRTVEKGNQIRVDNTHEPIIDKDTFEKVQCIFKKRGANTKLKYNYLLRGSLYCYHCKRKLQIVLKKDHPYITSSNYKKRGCYPLSINYEKFEKHIIYIAKEIGRRYADKEIFYKVYEKCQNKNFDNIESFKKKMEQIDKDIYEINNNLDKMYMDKIQEKILEEDYIRIYRKIYIWQDQFNETKRRAKSPTNRNKK